MARVTATEAAEKWARRTGQSTQDYVSGVKRVSQAPGVKAAQQSNAMLAGVTASVQSGDWQRKVAAVTLGDWQKAATDKGATRLASGVTAAAPKMAGVMAKVLADVDATLAEVERIPRGDINANIQRAVVFMTGMSNRAKQA
jgi:hypothetical protein